MSENCYRSYNGGFSSKHHTEQAKVLEQNVCRECVGSLNKHKTRFTVVRVELLSFTSLIIKVVKTAGS